MFFCSQVFCPSQYQHHHCPPTGINLMVTSFLIDHYLRAAKKAANAFRPTAATMTTATVSWITRCQDAPPNALSFGTTVDVIVS